MYRARMTIPHDLLVVAVFGVYLALAVPFLFGIRALCHRRGWDQPDQWED